MAAAAKASWPWVRLLSLWGAGRAATLRFSRHISTTPAGGLGSCCPRPHGSALSPRQFFIFPRHFSVISLAQRDRAIRDLLAEVEREKQREREEKRRAGEAVDEEAEEEEDFMGVGPLIEKWEKRIAKETGDDEAWEIPTDSDSDDDERFSPQEVQKRVEEFEKKHKRHEELLNKFAEAETLDEAHKWMTRIDKFEEKYLRLPLEYKVIGDLMNRLKHATEKEKFILQQKLNRAVRLMDCKEAYDPNNPANYGVIRHSQVGPSVDQLKYTDFEKEKKMIQGADVDEEEDEDFSEAKGKDDKLLERLNAIDKKLEEKLAELDHTFGKKGRVLEQEIKELADERSALTEKSRRPLYRKGFDVKVVDVNRTCKVTKGGQLTKYTALLACGNFNGVIGFAKAKGPTPRIAIQKAYEKCFQNLHHVERHEEHTIAHAVQTNYEKTKIYLWPAPTRSGVVGAPKTVETILYLAGFKNVKSKVIGSRNPHNTIKALFKALNAVETPKDIQEKFGRTVVESYLL